MVNVPPNPLVKFCYALAHVNGQSMCNKNKANVCWHCVVLTLRREGRQHGRVRIWNQTQAESWVSLRT